MPLTVCTSARCRQLWPALLPLPQPSPLTSPSRKPAPRITAPGPPVCMRADHRAPNRGAVREVDAAAAAGRAGHKRPQCREARCKRDEVGLVLRIAAARVDARIVGAAAAAARCAAFSAGGARPVAGARRLGVWPAAGYRRRRPRALAAGGASRGGAVAAVTRLGGAARARLSGVACGQAAGGDSAVGAPAGRASAAPAPRV